MSIDVKFNGTPPAAALVFIIDVNDHLPDDETTVMVADAEGDWCMAWHEGGKWWEINSDKVLENVTHWADLLPPPGEVRADGGQVVSKQFLRDVEQRDREQKELIRSLVKQVATLNKKLALTTGTPAYLVEAFNSGDGSYKP